MIEKHIGQNEYFSFVESVSQYFTDTFLADVRDVEFGQWEMPFEAMLLELIKRDKQNTVVDFKLIQDLAIESGIVQEGVLDPDTWKIFCEWAES